MNAPLPPGPEHSRGRDRSISPRRRMGGPGGPMGDRKGGSIALFSRY